MYIPVGMGNVVVCSEKRVVLPLLFTGLCLLVVFALGPARAVAAGATYYASPTGAGVISLPIQTWAITKVRSRAGGVMEWSKGVLLRKKIT